LDTAFETAGVRLAKRLDSMTVTALTAGIAFNSARGRGVIAPI